MKLTPQQVEQFRAEGYLIAEEILTDADLQPLIDEIDMFTTEHAKALQAEGKLTDLHEYKPFSTRFTYLHRQCPEMGRQFDIMHLRGKVMFDFLRNDNLMDAVESLLGPEITCSPIQHIRPKMPAGAQNHGGLISDVPWHQDAGVTWEEADPSEIITVWIPLLDATRENGCMAIMPRCHDKGILDHVSSSYGTTIDPEAMPDESQAICAECPKRGAVFMNKYTPHQGLSNQSADTARWTVDLRYQPADTPTGRPFHPDFVTRSRSNPSRVLTDHAQWCELWKEALSKPAPQAHRIKK